LGSGNAGSGCGRAWQSLNAAPDESRLTAAEVEKVKITETIETTDDKR
jgi:hypothetical protein